MFRFWSGCNDKDVCCLHVNMSLLLWETSGFRRRVAEVFAILGWWRGVGWQLVTRIFKDQAVEESLDCLVLEGEIIYIVSKLRNFPEERKPKGCGSLQ